MSENVLGVLNSVQERLAKVIAKMTKQGVEEMQAISIVLQEDPSTDMSKLQKNISITQGFLGTVTRLLNDAHTVQGKLVVVFNRAVWHREDKMNELLLSDEIMKTRPKAAQEAKISTCLVAEGLLIRKLKEDTQRVKTYLEILGESQAFLKKTTTTLAMQVGVLKGQVSIGEHRTNLDEGRQNF